jgi:hypothetical protein
MPHTDHADNALDARIDRTGPNDRGAAIARTVEPQTLRIHIRLQAEEGQARLNIGDATIVEGYPVEPRKDSMPEVYAFTGMASAFRKVGFLEAARRSETRPIMRYMLPTP